MPQITVGDYSVSRTGKFTPPCVRLWEREWRWGRTMINRLPSEAFETCWRNILLDGLIHSQFDPNDIICIRCLKVAMLYRKTTHPSSFFFSSILQPWRWVVTIFWTTNTKSIETWDYEKWNPARDSGVFLLSENSSIMATRVFTWGIIIGLLWGRWLSWIVWNHHCFSPNPYSLDAHTSELSTKANLSGCCDSASFIIESTTTSS